MHVFQRFLHIHIARNKIVHTESIIIFSFLEGGAKVVHVVQK